MFILVFWFFLVSQVPYFSVRTRKPGIYFVQKLDFFMLLFTFCYFATFYYRTRHYKCASHGEKSFLSCTHDTRVYIKIKSIKAYFRIDYRMAKNVIKYTRMRQASQYLQALREHLQGTSMSDFQAFGPD